ncbi:MAG: IS630 family transposase [Phycisphaerae bacterium]
MSAPYFVRPLTRSERSGLDAILRKPPDARVFLRAQAVDLSSRGWKVPEIAEIVRRDRSVVSRWLHRFEEEGIEGLWPRKSPGRPPKVTAEFRQAADEAARENPRDLGYEFTRWTADLLAQHLAETTGVEVGPATMRNTLAELGFRWGRPKLDLAHRQDPAEVARAKRLRNGALKKRSSVAAGGRSCISTKPNSI